MEFVFMKINILQGHDPSAAEKLLPESL